MNRYYRRRRAAALGILTVIVLAVVWAFGAWGTQSSQGMQGDQLGPDNGENLAAYSQRAQASLADASQPTYALVTFREPLPAQAAASALEGAPRVNSVIVGYSAPVPIPEPVDGHSREEVFETVFDRVDQSFAGIGDIPAPDTLSAVTVYADGDALRNLAAHPDIAAVEPAPADAAWGSFGVRPVGELSTG